MGLARLEIRTDGASLHPTHDPTVAQTRVDRRIFHGSDVVIVLVTPTRDKPDLLSRDGLAYVKRLHDSLSRAQGVDRHRIRSVASIFDPRPGQSLLDTSRFLDDLPEAQDDIDKLIRRILRSPLAEGLFLSADGYAAAIYVPIARGYDRQDALNQVSRQLGENKSPSFVARLTGPVPAEATLGQTVLRDLIWLTPLILSVIVTLLFVCLRSGIGVIVPLAESLTVLVWTLGMMGLCNVPLTLVTTILPVVLLSVAITDEVHVLERYKAHLRDNGIARRDAMAAALRDVARPVVLTSLTTSIGFLSFLTADTAPIRHFGLFAAMGVLLAMVLSFTLVPALVLILPPSWSSPGRPVRQEREPRTHRSSQPGNRSVLIGIFLVILAAPGLLSMRIEDSWIDNFAPSSAIASAESVFNKRFWGSYRFDIVLESDELEFFQQSEGLRLVEEVLDIVKAAPHVGGSASHLLAYEFLAELENEPGKVSALPSATQKRFSKVLHVIQAWNDFDHYLLHDGRKTTVRLYVGSANYTRTGELEEYLHQELPALFRNSAVAYHFSGDLPVAQACVRSIVSNLLSSMVWAIAGVGILLALILRSVRSALLAMTPLFAGILIVVGAMGYLQVPFGIATGMFATVTLGVAVDFGVHFMHAYRRGTSSGLTHEDAIQMTMQSAGRAIRWNVTILTLGLLVLVLSSLKPNRHLGLLLAASMVTCYATTVLMLPNLLRGAKDTEPPAR